MKKIHGYPGCLIAVLIFVVMSFGMAIGLSQLLSQEKKEIGYKSGVNIKVHVDSTGKIVIDSIKQIKEK